MKGNAPDLCSNFLLFMKLISQKFEKNTWEIEKNILDKIIEPPLKNNKRIEVLKVPYNKVFWIYSCHYTYRVIFEIFAI